MILLAFTIASLVCAAIPATLTLANMLEYTPPPPIDQVNPSPAITVIIPARNEQANIRAVIESVLASTNVDLEVLVLNDQSTDNTAAIVIELAATDARIQHLPVHPLPPGWNGKQHACWQGAQGARSPILVFLDADVRLHPQALARMVALLYQSGAALASGFPQQQTVTLLEWLLLPLIHFVLLGLLPMRQLRTTNKPGFAAGCGQFFMLRREPYFAVDGHSAIRSTMHDGLLLPRLLRSHGYATRLADLTMLATCRMYHSSSNVWSGLSKNATEGLAAPGAIVPLTLLLGLGQIAPVILLTIALTQPSSPAMHRIVILSAITLTLGYVPRILNAIRYRQSWRGVLLHPIGVATLLVLQWTAFLRKLRGHTPTWKDRSYPTK